MLASPHFASRALFDKEVTMRRFSSAWTIVAGFCMTCAIGGSESFGRDDLRTSGFRALTHEPPAGPAMTAAAQQASKVSAIRPPSVSSSTPASPTTSPLPSQARAPTIVRSTAASQTPRPASFRGGTSARQTMSQFPHRAAIRSNPRHATHRQPKPFESAEHEPTLSPYLNLDRDEDDTQGVPNYLAFVRPQLEQIQTNRTQQREIQQLRGQLQNMSTNASGPPAFETSRSARVASSARFMDTAQFYGGIR
jgi:hypothetical protein